jgi:hypothetical protein
LDVEHFRALSRRWKEKQEKQARRDAIFLAFFGNVIIKAAGGDADLKPDDFLNQQGEEKKEEEMTPEQVQAAMMNIAYGQGGKVQYMRN